MSKKITLGSLFDGIGGFPLSGTMCGVEPVWASEIEPFPIAVTMNRFPNMKHLGSVTDIKGDRLRRFHRHRRASGRTCAYFAHVRQVHPSSVRGRQGRRCRDRMGAQRGRKEKAHRLDYEEKRIGFDSPPLISKMQQYFNDPAPPSWTANQDRICEQHDGAAVHPANTCDRRLL